MKKNILFIPVLASLMLFAFVRPAHANIIDTLEGWANTVQFVKDVVDTDGENMGQLVNKFAYGAGEAALTTVCLECTTAEERVLNDPTLPAHMKISLTGMVDKQVTAMFNNHPRVDVVAHLANEWVPGYKESNAVYAGGYDDLNDAGLSGLWSITRNIAYIGFVVIMIAIGFMIMFRNKIGGQALVTLGNSIPRVVVALVLVTFSFAIMGLIIDFGGVLMRVFHGMIYDDPAAGIAIYNPIELFMGFIGQNATQVAGTGSALDIGVIVTSLVALMATGVGSKVAIGATIGILIIALILAGIILWGAIKLWIVLIKAYLGLLVNLVVAPLAILFGALPGNESTTTNIFKSALRNVLVFPLAYAIVNLPYAIEEKGFSLVFPESLATQGVGGIGMDFFIQIAKIVAIYAACSAPAILQGIIPSTASKSGADAAAAIKAGLSGVPLIGGMFK